MSPRDADSGADDKGGAGSDAGADDNAGGADATKPGRGDSADKAKPGRKPTRGKSSTAPAAGAGDDPSKNVSGGQPGEEPKPNPNEQMHDPNAKGGDDDKGSANKDLRSPR